METLILFMLEFLCFWVALFSTLTFFLGAIKWFNHKRWPEIFKNPVDAKFYNYVMIASITLWSILYMI